MQQRLLGEGERENEKARREAASLFASTFSTFYLGYGEGQRLRGGVF